MKLIIFIVFISIIKIKSNNEWISKGNFLRENIDHDKNKSKSENYTNKISNILYNVKESFPFPNITEVSTDIILKSNCNSIINERVTFFLENGLYSTVIKLISLAGSSSFFQVILSYRSDVTIEYYKIIDSCYSNINHVQPYICILAVFKEINLLNNQKFVTIQYNYIGKDTLWRQYYEIDENIFKWKIENSNNLNVLKSSNLTIHFEKNINFSDISSSQNENLLKNNKKANLVNFYQINNIKISNFSFYNITINLKNYSQKCKILNNIRILFNYGSMLNVFFVFTGILVFGFLIIHLSSSNIKKAYENKLND